MGCALVLLVLCELGHDVVSLPPLLTCSSGEVYDPESDTWLQLPTAMATERKYCAAAAAGGRVYVVGGMNQERRRLVSVEAFDPREGLWQALPPLQVARSSAGCAVLQDRLYVVGGSATDTAFLDSVECFNPAAGQWATCAPVACGRSGLSIAPF